MPEVQSIPIARIASQAMRLCFLYIAIFFCIYFPLFIEHGEFSFHKRGHAFCTISLNHVYPSLQDFAIDGTGGLSNSIPLRINEQRCRERIHSIGRGRIGIQVIEHWERVTFLLDKR